MPYLSPTSPAKAKSISAPRGNISDHRWLQAYNAMQCHGNLTPMWFSQSRPHCDVCGWAEVSLSLCIYHGGSAATPILGAALVRSDCEFVSRTVNSAHRLPTKRRACSVRIQRSVVAECSCRFNLAAMQRKVSEILLLNFQGTARKNFYPLT